MRIPKFGVIESRVHSENAAPMSVRPLNVPLSGVNAEPANLERARLAGHG